MLTTRFQEFGNHLRGLFYSKGPRDFRLKKLAEILPYFSMNNERSEDLFFEKLSIASISTNLSDYETQWLARLKDLAELRYLLCGSKRSGLLGLKQALCFQKNVKTTRSGGYGEIFLASEQDILDASLRVGELYWKLFETASTDRFPELKPLAQQLLTLIFDMPFNATAMGYFTEDLTTVMQQDGGVSFLIINLLHQEELSIARRLNHRLLTMELGADELTRTSLYWIGEILWFLKHSHEVIRDFETSIRFLYHLCFTNPERTGFLEVDSQFFSQFETVNELAREGFLFKEPLVENIMDLWKNMFPFFGGVFQNVLEILTQRKNKIYDELPNWQRLWKVEKQNFGKDYLYLVEGNLSFASGQYEDALDYYQKALSHNPNLRGALLNCLFCYAKLNLPEAHAEWVEYLRTLRTIYPTVLYAIGNSYLLLGNEQKADEFYNKLKTVEGWRFKTYYYKSTFCYENGLFSDALRFAKKAFEENPTDSAVGYHLSLCYSAMGNKQLALDALNKISASADIEWLKFYRFTLERDSGNHYEASQTLLKIPREYFQDPDELAAALEFAKSQTNLVLLRHLRHKE